jgi:hypothetical protein
MKELKVHPAVTVGGSILLVCLVLGGLVWLRASKDFDDTAAFGAPLTHDRPVLAEQPPPVAETRRQAVVRLLSAATLDQTRQTLRYDPAYVRISYPGGDVPQDRGVCADVIVRAFRKIGVDLQKEVHEDMLHNFAAYPRFRGSSRPDANIDQRRVPNLMTFFKRRGAALPVTRNPTNYLPGDVVAWDLGHGQTHIGLLVNQLSPDGRRPMVVHNIGQGARVEDVLFTWKVIGHYRYPTR